MHRYSLRNSRHHDIYTPLVPPGWKPGDPVTLLAQDVISVHDDGSRRTPPTVLEGTPRRHDLPGWIGDAMRSRGLVLIADPVTLHRDDLHGVDPGADIVAAIIWFTLGGAFGLSALCLAWGMHRSMQQMRRADRPA